MFATDSATAPQYRMDPTRFARMRRTMIIRAALFAPLFLAGMWYFELHTGLNRGIVAFVSVSVILAWEFYRSVRREQDKWRSLVLEFRGNNLIRTLPGYPVLDIAPSELTTIVEFSGGIIVRTKSRRKTLIVGRDLLGYDDFHNRLAAWAPIVKVMRRKPSFRGVVSILWCALMFGGPLYLLYTPHREFILPLGIVLITGMAAMVLYYQDSPIMPTSFRKTSWILVALPLLITITRLFGHW
jgi:hypothetical protein